MSPHSLVFRPSKSMPSASRQGGLVLFFALIAMVAMSLAAVALVRSVDTATLISGNLAFRQSATSSGDGGVESAIAVLAAIDTANNGTNVFQSTAHPFNADNATIGYYSNIDPNLNLTASATWGNYDDDPEQTSATTNDGNGNRRRYIIQRMCRTANQVLSITNCLFSSAATDNSGKTVPLPSEICEGSGCPRGGQSPLYRVTVRITGPKNTVSYIQSIVH